jgi:hypoxanthine phosphoribosyltransferase
VRTQVQDLGHRIGEEMEEDTLLIALLGGSVIFLADLVRAIERPVRFEFIQVGFEGETAEAGVVEIRYPLPLDLAGQSVLVLKDVVTSGVTEPYLEQQLRDHGARDVRFAALIDIPDERKTDFQVRYAAFQTGRQGLLVGYGLKHDGLYGNLPYVARIRGAS